MKRTLFILFLILGLTQFAKAQTSSVSGFNTYVIYCENINNADASNDLKNYLLNNYADRISSYTVNLDEKTASVTTNLQAEDILQLYRSRGYAAIYLSETEGRFRLNDMGRLHWIKE